PSPLEKRRADSLPDKSFSRIGRRMPDEGRLRDDGKRENLNFSNTDSIQTFQTGSLAQNWERDVR
ncbi:MAG: hypothetical protein NT023_22980, partial [Armatimonadetes bacterium]|nr:hypothetical protein [Armatimonadota bacterium]